MAGCGPEPAVFTGCSCLPQDRGCDGMEPGSSPGAAAQTTLGLPSPPSGSAGLCFGALAQARLLHRDLGGLPSGGTMCFLFRQLCRDLGGCFLVGEGALLLGSLRDVLAVGKAQSCSCAGSSLPQAPWGDAGEGPVCRVGERWAGHHSSHSGPFGTPWLGLICLVALCSCPRGWTAACPGMSGLCRDRRSLPLCHPPQCSCFHVPGTEDLGRWLGLWATVTFLAFSSYPGCLHPSVFCRLETPGLVSAGAWRGWWVPSPLRAA